MNHVTHNGVNAPQRRLGALAIFASTCAVVFLGAGAVHAATPDTSASTSPSVPAPSAYPPAENCALQSQPSSVIPGATVIITGLAASNTTVSAVLTPEASTIGTAPADTTGKYSISAAVPSTAANGDTITVAGVTCATVTVVTPTTTTPAPPLGSNVVSPIIATPAVSSSIEASSVSKPATVVTPTPKAVQIAQVKSSKPLAFTGASVLVPGVLGLVLIGGGLILFVLGRRGKAGQN